ncbi:MAG: hypothetical protein RBU25_04025 [Lentisphaeria bacterium]|jgi:hypothetical protein|nr:hypothetical protein [Lentisphaeria bacterium]
MPSDKPNPAAPSAALHFAWLGWLVALALLGIAGADLRATGAKLREIAGQRPGRIREINEQCQTTLAAIAAEKRLAADQHNELLALQGRLEFDIKTLKLSLAELEPQAKNAERNFRKLSETSAHPEAPPPSPENLAERKSRLAELERANQELRAQYQLLENELRANLQAILEQPDPIPLKQWYAARSHTVFAPAAGVFAAEKLYAREAAREALDLYEEILRRFPEPANPKLPHCRDRVRQILDGQAYTTTDLTLQGYYPLRDTSPPPQAID